ncbi:MAG TPA: UvrD-helicase domain-containing protein [Gemmatimonadaceae bacterium]|nr:UvrD-helicase domain-containing protein [Gemmatimonadaceae bacterium]
MATISRAVRETPNLMTAAPVPSPSQREAVEAEPGPLLVLAGPGAGKTFCLIERIRFLIEQASFAPSRICAFTFTNKAADEIAHRLERTLGDHGTTVKSGTIHAFCAELLREHADRVGLPAGFGIADEEYQLNALRRIEGPRNWHRSVLTQFSANRFRGAPLARHEYYSLLERYERFLAQRKMVDFDTLVLKAAELLEHTPEASAIRARWDVVLVDEFQDLNPVQYRVIRELARAHEHLFAVGDHEQSIYSFAGADPGVFSRLLNDFRLARKIRLEENRRCPREVFALARRLVSLNPQLFDDLPPPQANRESRFAPAALSFATDDAERDWIVEDIRRDRAEYGHDWSEIALLYRTNEMGEALEAAFLNAGIPCRLSRGRALAEDPVVGYVIAALRVIASPNDPVHGEAFFEAVLSRVLFDQARMRAEETKQGLLPQLYRIAAQVSRAGEDGRQVHRALSQWRNLQAIGCRHTALAPLIADLLSQRVGHRRSVLEDRHDELSDPVDTPEVVALADRLRDARARRAAICLPLNGGVEIPLKGMLLGLGFGEVHTGDVVMPRSERISPHDCRTLGLPLGLFKAAQLLESRDFGEPFRDFTAIDLETTSDDPDTAEIVEIAAVRVRDGRACDEFKALVKPRGRIPQSATDVHGLRDADVEGASRFEDVWPHFRRFCGRDIIAAHNGYEYDFRILKRMVKALGARYDLCTYDTLPLACDLYSTSHTLINLARTFGIAPGRSHRALADAQTLAQVAVRLDEAKLARARKSALLQLLGHLGVALALSDQRTLCPEAVLFRDITRPFALGRYSGSLEYYEAESAGNESIPTVDEVIASLGGAKLMMKIRADKTAEELYPTAMPRLRRLIERIPEGSLEAQITAFLECVVLSRYDGHEPERGRVNLLTLHSTKGLEFSRVYIVGSEDAHLPGRTPSREATPEEVEEARRLLYVGMTRVKERIVLTHVQSRGGRPSGGHRFLDEMGLVPVIVS